MIYVMSDIHGNMRRFNSIMEQIDLQAEDTLYILGDVIDRHPDGLRILQRIMAMPNVKMLLGNHEFMMLQSLGIAYTEYNVPNGDQSMLVRRWYNNGGRVTHQYWKHIRKDLRAKIADYLMNLPTGYDITVNGTPYKLVHAAPEEDFASAQGKYRYRDCFEFAVWYRRWLDDPSPEGYTLIFGHTSTEHFQPGIPMRIYFDTNLVGIDCGSGYPDDVHDRHYGHGRLACLRLDDMKEFYSEERTEEWRRLIKKAFEAEEDE